MQNLDQVSTLDPHMITILLVLHLKIRIILGYLIPINVPHHREILMTTEAMLISTSQPSP